MVGPKLQQDIASIILRWRRFCYVYTADIAKMFRQIQIHSDNTDFQKILWRPPTAPSVQHYRLTYGLASAPYLAMRVLRQLSVDEGDSFPAARLICENSVYVDDILFGADDVSTLLDTRSQLVSLLLRGGFPFHKWSTNSTELLQDVPENRESKERIISEDDSFKVLGLSWSPNEDSFRFLIASNPTSEPTKRSILSIMSMRNCMIHSVGLPR